MCDSFVYVDNNGCWFAKNSDREPNESQLVEWLEGAIGEDIQNTTYIEVSTPEKKYATWLSRPSWMWGGEMGVNENGVAIGNEAVFTRLINRKSSALLGMDLLRLALQQSYSADQALEVITDYLEKYGQGGIAGYQNKKFFYDNSFLIVDAGGGWQLETAGQFWVAKKIDLKNPMVAISNTLSITNDFDLMSVRLPDKARTKGYWNGKGDFDFSKTFSTWFMPWAGAAKKRQNCNMKQLKLLDNSLPIAPQLAQILRQHRRGKKPSSNGDVCMHAKGLLRPSQTTQSMICQLSSTSNKTWMTGGSAPCMSLFKPLNNAKNSWLLKHVNFWEEWDILYRKFEMSSQLKTQLQQYNSQIEAQLWAADEATAIQLMDDWWLKIKNL